MPDGGFRTITVTEQLYERVKRQARESGSSVAGYVSEILLSVFKVEDSLAGCASPFQLISIGQKDVVVRDRKKDKIVGVKARPADGGKVKFYCELDGTDYCNHTAFAAALPQARNAIRR